MLWILHMDLGFLVEGLLFILDQRVILLVAIKAVTWGMLVQGVNKLSTYPISRFLSVDTGRRV